MERALQPHLFKKKKKRSARWSGEHPDGMHSWMQCKCDDSLIVVFTFSKQSYNCSCTHAIGGHDVQAKRSRKNNYLFQIVFSTSICMCHTLNCIFFAVRLLIAARWKKWTFKWHKLRNRQQQSREKKRFEGRRISFSISMHFASICLGTKFSPAQNLWIWFANRKMQPHFYHPKIGSTIEICSPPICFQRINKTMLNSYD